MSNPRTNRRPLTRVARFGSLGALVPVSIVVAGLQVGPVSASRSGESTGNAVEREQPAEPSSGRITAFVPVAASAAALQNRVQVGPAAASRTAESTGSAVEREQSAEPSSGRFTAFVPVSAAPAALQERVQVGPVSAPRSAESIGSTVGQEQPAEPSSGRFTAFVPMAGAPAALQERVQVGPVSASRSAETTGSAVEQEQRAQGRSGRRGFWRAPGWASSSCLPDSASRSPSTWRTTSPAECVCTPAPVSGSDGRRAGIP